MNARNLIRTFIHAQYEDAGILPSWHDIAEHLEDQVPLEAFELIDEEMKSFNVPYENMKGEVVNG